MAKTISQLPDATVVNGSDELIIQQSGVTKRATKTEVLAGIVNANVDAAAAILGTKIAPDFGSQNAVTTGNVTAAKLIPTGNSATGNGMYLPATNAVAVSTNGSERLRIDASGNVGIGTSSPVSPLHVVGSSVFGTINVSSTSSNAEASISFFDSGDTNADKWVVGKNVGGVTSDAFCFYKNGNLAVIDGNGNFGIGTATPSAAAILDASSTTKGFLPPRMTTAQRDAISTPPAGLMIYNTSTNVLNFYNGSAWGAV